MSNAKTMTTGGANSTIGPILIQKAVPFRGSARSMIASERPFHKDSLFSSARAQISALSFRLDRTQISSELDSQIQRVREGLNQAVTFKKPFFNTPK